MTSFQLLRPATVDEALQLLSTAAPVIDCPTQRLIFSPAHQREAFERGARKPAWVWAARDAEGRTAGVVAAWGAPSKKAPWLIDLIDLPLDDPNLSQSLLAFATAEMAELGAGAPQINLFTPPSADPEGDAAVLRVLAITKACGYRTLVVRRRYELLPAVSASIVPETMLHFEALADAADPRALRVYSETLVGTLDAHSQAALAEKDLSAVAEAELREMFELDRPEAFYLVSNGGGDLIGLVVGGLRGGAGRGVVSFVGVSHHHRGNGYARQLLRWMTARLVAAGATRIIAETDVANVPMANTFAAVGYPQTESRIDLTFRA